MTPTIGWIMTFVALGAVTGLVVTMRRGSALKAFTQTALEEVKVKMTCGTDTFSLVVDPWHVHVKKGKPLKWVLDGPAGSKMTIEPQVQQPGDWPFTARPDPSQAGPGAPIRTGNVKNDAVEGSTHKYSILLECDGRKFDIDPDIYILN